MIEDIVNSVGDSMGKVVEATSEDQMPHGVTQFKLVFKLNEMVPVLLRQQGDSNCEGSGYEKCEDQAIAFAFVADLFSLH